MATFPPVMTIPEFHDPSGSAQWALPKLNFDHIYGRPQSDTSHSRRASLFRGKDMLDQWLGEWSVRVNFLH